MSRDLVWRTRPTLPDSPATAGASGEASVAGWTRLATSVHLRRLSLELTSAEAARRAGVAESHWKLVEAGSTDGYPVTTFPRMAAALDWPDDALDRILDGETDLPVLQPAPQQAASGPAGLAERIGRLSARDQRVVEQLVDAMLDG